MISGLFDKLLHPLYQDFSQSEFDDLLVKLQKAYPGGEDPWGLNVDKSCKSLKYIWLLYKKYFKVRVFGKENVENTNYVVASNHSGQIAIDGMLICAAFIFEMENPRILRGMADRFVAQLPFFATWAAEGGMVLGDRKNCLELLKRKESVLVFPEGVKGVAKSTNEFYNLQRFTRGFYRMAATTNTQILPISVIGAEEVFPWVYQARGIASTLGLPALPLSPCYFPLPSPIDIYIGEPVSIPEELSTNATDLEIDKYVSQIKSGIQSQLDEGLKIRRQFFANQGKGSAK